VKTKLEEDGDEDGLRYSSKAIDTIRKQVCMLSEPLIYYHQLLTSIIFHAVLTISYFNTIFIGHSSKNH
jgi:hypothetical protein